MSVFSQRILTQFLDMPILVEDDDDEEIPVDVAFTSRSLNRHDRHKVTGSELSVIQQGGERSKVNTTISGRASEEHHLAAASKMDYDEIASAEGGEASKGKTRRAQDLRSSEKSNISLDGRAIAASPSHGDMDYVYRLPQQQRDQYALLKSRDVLPSIEGVAGHDAESAECANQHGTKRKAPSSLPGRGQVAKQVCSSIVPQHPVKERDTDAPSSKSVSRNIRKHSPEFQVPLGRRARSPVLIPQCGAAMDRHHWMRRTISMLSSACSHVMFGMVERNTL